MVLTEKNQFGPTDRLSGVNKLSGCHRKALLHSWPLYHQRFAKEVNWLVYIFKSLIHKNIFVPFCFHE